MKHRLWLSLITCLAYCIDKELYKAIDYLREQVRVLVEHQEKKNKRILLTNNQRMRVAAKAKRLSRKMLEQCTDLFTPDTVMRWYRKLIAEKYDGSQNRTYAGRPPTPQEVVDLIIQFKQEKPLSGDLSTPLVHTKLEHPPVRPEIVPRTGLLDRLNEGHQQTLILISAAASYGKRTLAGRWVPTCNCPSSWVSLHESKSNLRMSHTYVVATIRSLFPKMNLQREIHLDADQLPGPAVSAHHLLNDLTGVKEPSSLAPADYHNTRGKLVFDLVMELLTHPPPAVSLVLEHWLRLLNTSQFFRLRRWQSWLPEDVTASNPLLLLNPAAWG